MSDTDYEVRLKSTGRNDVCPCGSGKKYKRCHLAEDERAQAVASKARQEEALAKARTSDSEDQDAKGDRKEADKSVRSTQREKKQPGKGRGSGGVPKNIPRRGAV